MTYINQYLNKTFAQILVVSMIASSIACVPDTEETDGSTVNAQNFSQYGFDQVTVTELDEPIIINGMEVRHVGRVVQSGDVMPTQNGGITPNLSNSFNVYMLGSWVNQFTRAVSDNPNNPEQAFREAADATSFYDPGVIVMNSTGVVGALWGGRFPNPAYKTPLSLPWNVESVGLDAATGTLNATPFALGNALPGRDIIDGVVMQFMQPAGNLRAELTQAQASSNANECVRERALHRALRNVFATANNVNMSGSEVDDSELVTTGGFLLGVEERPRTLFDDILSALNPYAKQWVQSGTFIAMNLDPSNHWALHSQSGEFNQLPGLINQEYNRMPLPMWQALVGAADAAEAQDLHNGNVAAGLGLGLGLSMLIPVAISIGNYVVTAYVIPTGAGILGTAATLASAGQERVQMFIVNRLDNLRVLVELLQSALGRNTASNQKLASAIEKLQLNPVTVKAEVDTLRQAIQATVDENTRLAAMNQFMMNIINQNQALARQAAQLQSRLPIVVPQAVTPIQDIAQDVLERLAN